MSSMGAGLHFTIFPGSDFTTENGLKVNLSPERFFGGLFPPDFAGTKMLHGAGLRSQAQPSLTAPSSLSLHPNHPRSSALQGEK